MKKEPLSRLLIRLLTVAMLGVSLSACAPTPTRRDVPEVADDALLTTRVKAALVKNSVSDAADVQVETYRGVVQLSGFADSPDVAQKAVSAASSVEGVRSVKNDIRIKSSR